MSIMVGPKLDTALTLEFILIPQKMEAALIPIDECTIVSIIIKLRVDDIAWIHSPLSSYDMMRLTCRTLKYCRQDTHL